MLCSQQLQSELYWQRGVHLTYAGGTLCIEAVISRGTVEGVLVTVTSTNGRDFSLLTLACDQIEAVLEQWYPGKCHLMRKFDWL